ncbi:MAG: AraC family transcriptional regulator [Clostridia bacterium]|nr:AraC family transcriptional regulator [Clostridia bacterium]
MIRPSEPQRKQTPRKIHDSPLYTPTEIMRRSGETDVDFSAYYVLHMELTAGGVPVTRLKEPLQNVFQSAQICFLPLDKRQACVVLCHSMEDVPACCNELESVFSAFAGHPVNIGVSMQCSGPEYLAVAFDQADTALEKAFYQPESNVYLYYAETCAVTNEGRDTDELLRPFAEAVSVGDAERCRGLLEELFHDQQSTLRPHEVRQEGISLLDLCHRELRRVGAGTDKVESFAVCKRILPTCPSFLEYCELVSTLMTETAQAVKNKLKIGGNAILDARNYIDENYRRPISASDVAEAINVNPGYLSRIFKGKTGVNLMDMINGKKVTHAKELLGGGSLKVNEVAGKVGIDDQAYFSHLFKKYTGMSPREYQKVCLHKHEPGG